MRTWAEYLKKETLFSNAIRLQHLFWTILRYVPEGSRTLETGFGSGMTAILLADLGYSVTALDTDGELIHSVNRRAGSLTKKGALKFLQGDMFALPLKAKSFALAYHQGVLEHFSDQEIIQALKENARVADLVIFDIPNSRSKVQDFGDERLLKPAYWRDLILKSDLRIVKELGRAFPNGLYILPHLLFSRYGIQAFPHFSRLFALSSIFVCQPNASTIPGFSGGS